MKRLGPQEPAFTSATGGRGRPYSGLQARWAQWTAGVQGEGEGGAGGAGGRGCEDVVAT